jgi:hypothetical protein
MVGSLSAPKPTSSTLPRQRSGASSGSIVSPSPRRVARPNAKLSLTHLDYLLREAPIPASPFARSSSGPGSPRRLTVPRWTVPQSLPVGKRPRTSWDRHRRLPRDRYAGRSAPRLPGRGSGLGQKRAHSGRLPPVGHRVRARDPGDRRERKLDVQHELLLREVGRSPRKRARRASDPADHKPTTPPRRRTKRSSTSADGRPSPELPPGELPGPTP